MADRLQLLLKGKSPVAIAGMCKNAGKTTVLNHLIAHAAPQGLALTSIGRDGEDKDLVTGTPKPGIAVRTGTLVATAAELLRACDVTREIVESTGMQTPLGEVVLFRALSDGHVQLAGPSMVAQLRQIAALFGSLGARRILFDGALGRRSLCSVSVAGASLLCTGASCGRSVDVVVEQTRHVCAMAGLPRLGLQPLREHIAANRSARMLLWRDGPAALDADDLVRTVRAGPGYLYIDGALTDTLAERMARGGMAEGMVLVVGDASRILLKAAAAQKLYRAGYRLMVLEQMVLAGVCINPFSAYGYPFDREEFMAKMAAAVEVPVINVEDECR